MRGDSKDSYMKLPEFFYILKEANPSSYIEIKTNFAYNFRYGIMETSSCINRFVKYMRPFVIVDGAFIKKKQGRLLLVCDKGWKQSNIKFHFYDYCLF